MMDDLQGGFIMNSNQRSQGNNQSDNGGNEKPVSSSRGVRHLPADENLDDDTGLSNRANRQSADVEQGDRQAAQSNVGRRDDGTPD
jgi:hypothetical protein